ncbi:MAG TPA: helix-turn-helix transcriptional regulator [Isosphaeraceae bacterium]|nr:helix-turn-helix transcriptional regulator [Isosphaeraceae bacterium]
MRFAGRVYKDGKFWLAELPILDAMTQGRTRREAFAMVADLLETLVDRPGFTVSVHPGSDDHFEVSAPDMRPLISLLLRRQRERNGLSLADAAARLGSKSRNTYARYERGTFLPSLEKLDALLRAVSPDRDFVLHPGTIGSGRPGL